MRFFASFCTSGFDIQEITLNLGRDKSTKYHSMLAYDNREKYNKAF